MVDFTHRLEDLPRSRMIGIYWLWSQLEDDEREQHAALKRDVAAFIAGEPPDDAGPQWLHIAIQYSRQDLIRILCGRGVRPNEAGIKAFFHCANYARSLLQDTQILLHDAIENHGAEYKVHWRNSVLGTYGNDCEVFNTVFPYVASIIFDAQDTHNVPLAACYTLAGYGMQFDACTARKIVSERMYGYLGTPTALTEVERKSLAFLRELHGDL